MRKAIALIGIAGILTGSGYAYGASRGDVREFPATIRCRTAYLNEDAAANLKLKKFALNADGTQELIYRCASGY